jgi:hypothetical protein
MAVSDEEYTNLANLTLTLSRVLVCILAQRPADRRSYIHTLADDHSTPEYTLSMEYDDEEDPTSITFTLGDPEND